MFNITSEQHEKIFKAATSRWGIKSQNIQAIEEISELQVELCKFQNNRKSINNSMERARLADELADTLIMSEQVFRNYNLSSFGQDKIEAKIKDLVSSAEDASSFSGADKFINCCGCVMFMSALLIDLSCDDSGVTRGEILESYMATYASIEILSSSLGIKEELGLRINYKMESLGNRLGMH